MSARALLDALQLRREQQSIDLAKRLPAVSPGQARAVSAPGIRLRKLRKNEN